MCQPTWERLKKSRFIKSYVKKYVLHKSWKVWSYLMVKLLGIQASRNNDPFSSDGAELITNDHSDEINTHDHQ